jgi:glycosidase
MLKQRISLLLWAALITLVVGLLLVPPALASLGFVGNMSPAGGSTNTVTGGSFTVSVEVWKNNVTNFGGQGAGITCALHWGTVGYFGGNWSSVTDTAMSYTGDSGNNDVYSVTVSPGVGLYEYTAFCTDTTDSNTTWVGGSNGKFILHSSGGGRDCDGPAQGNNDIYWNGLKHDSFSTTYRNPIGPVTNTVGTVTLQFRSCMNDLNGVPYIRVYDQATSAEIRTPGNSNAALSLGSHATDSTSGDVTYWNYSLTIPTTDTIYYYVFKATDGSSTAYYSAQYANVYYGDKTNLGGIGQALSSQTTAYDNSYQVTIYDPNFSAPSWMQRGAVYQIFPDRFRDGNTGNDPAAGRFFYNQAGGIITRSNQVDWNYTVCDPRNVSSPTCNTHYSDNFYGGDLQGITDKINQGFFDNLGVGVIYLNPIFRSPSNHKYDTADYTSIDPDFGTLTDFQNLVSAAQSHDMKIVLDGVFNHTSSDSKYFDRYSRYDVTGTLTSSGVGTDDNSGACEGGSSSFYSWFYFPDTGNAGKDGAVTIYCNNGASDAAQTYEAWYGYSSLPKLQANSTAVRNLIWNNGLNSVGPYWTNQGVNGWRFDVGGDVDGGLPTNGYWPGFRSAVRSVYSQTLLLGEEWGDSSKWLLGNEWDSVMNYRYRATVMSWLFTGCSGSGCSGGTQFSDNDSNSGSASGAIGYLSPSQFNTRLRSIQEDYPPMAFKSMMNLEGSHDTGRIRFELKKSNNDNDSAAVQRMKEMWLFAFTYAGAPTIYYGDEVGLNQDDVWDGSAWQDDPYNRAPYPWPDATGSSFTPDTSNLLSHFRKMSSIRLSYRALQDGDVQHGLIIDDANKVYGFARTNGSQTALIALNRDSSNHSAVFSGLTASPYNLSNNTVMSDVINGVTYTVTGGSITATVNSSWGVVLLEQNKIDVPNAPSNVTVARLLTTTDVLISWPLVRQDTNGSRELVTAYEVWRSTTAAFTPGYSGSVKLADVTPPAFGSDNGVITYTDSNVLNPLMSLSPRAPNADNFYYAVQAVNSASQVSSESNVAGITPTAITLIDFAADAQPAVNWKVWAILFLAAFIISIGWRRRSRRAA